MSERALRLRLLNVDDQARLLEEVRALLRALDASLAKVDAGEPGAPAEIDFLLTLPPGAELIVGAIDRGIETPRPQDAERAPDVTSLRRMYETLTAREREVYTLVVRGLLNRQIASSLEITERTVKSHRARVMTKMRAASIAELTRYAVSLGV